MPGTRTPLYGRNVPGGIFTITDQSITTGDTWFVCSGTGTNSAGYGLGPDGPFKSLDYAVSQVTNNNGDRIYLMPGHVETLTAAGSSVGNGGVFIGATLSNTIEIIGLGVGRKRPIFNYTTAVAASMNIAAANVTIRNCVFTVGIDAVTAMVNVTGADVWFDNCEFVTGTATLGVVLGILTAATADRLKVTNCRFIAPAACSGTTTTACIQHESGVDYLIDRCYFTGKLTQAIKNVATVYRGVISNNVIVNGNANDAIIMAAASTPMITGNFINVAGGTAPVTSAAGFMAGNTYSAAPGVTAGAAKTW